MEANKFYCKECHVEVEVDSYEEIISRNKLCDNCGKPNLAKLPTKRYCGSRQKRLNRTLVKRLEQSKEDYNKKNNKGFTYDDSE